MGHCVADNSSRVYSSTEEAASFASFPSAYSQGKTVRQTAQYGSNLSSEASRWITTSRENVDERGTYR